MDLKNNIDNYGYIWYSMDKNIKALKKLKNNRKQYFIFNYIKYKIKSSDFKFIVENFDKVKTYDDLIQKNNDFDKGILPTFIKMCHFTYYKRFLRNDFFNIKELIFFNEELLVFKYNKALFINIRGTTTYKQLEILQNLTLYKKQFFFHEKINQDFLKWKNKLLKTKDYSIKNLLKKDSISDRFLFHKGFIELYQAYKIKDKIFNILEKCKNINNIYLSGHSLGGGLCTFLTLDLYERYYELKQLNNIKVNIITFGSPGIMNSNLSLFFYYLTEKKFLNKYIRIINKKDIISSSFTDPQFYLTKLTGILRHIDASVPKNKKLIIRNSKDKINKNILLIDCEKYLNNYLNKKELSYTEIHSLFSFSEKKNGILFSI